MLATNIFHLVADVANHESTTVESVQSKILAIFKFNADTVFCINNTNYKALYNSNLGSVIFLTEATFNLEQSSLLGGNTNILHKLSC
jgi:hypothetical protein